MKLRRAAAAAACLTALAMPAAAAAADPLPPGAASPTTSSTSTARPTPRASPRASSTASARRDILVVTGPLRLQDLRRHRPGEPGAPRHVHAARDQPGQRLLAGRGHGARHEAQPDHRCARPAAQRGRPGRVRLPRQRRRSPCATRTAAAASSSSPTATRRTSRQIGDFVSLPAGHTASCIQDCKYIWTGGPARRDDQGNLGPIIPQGSAAPAPSVGSNRLIGDGRPIWVTDLRNPAKPVGLRRADRPVAQRRLHGLLARRRRGRAGHRLGRRPRRHARLRHLGQAPRPVPEPRSAGRRRSTRSSSPAAAWRGTTRASRATTAPRSP